MKKTSIIIASAATAMVASGALADGVEYASGSLSYFTVDDFSAASLEGEVVYGMGGFTIAGEVDIYDSDYYDINSVGLTFGYEVMPGLTPYAFYDNLSGDIDFSAYGVGVEYATDSYGVAFEYRTFDESIDDFYTLAGYYEFGSSTVHAAIVGVDDEKYYALGYEYAAGNVDAFFNTSWNDSGFDNGITAFGGAYAFMGKFEAGLSILTSNDEFLDYGYYDVTFGYDITDTYGLTATVGSGFGDGYFDETMVTLALEFELGNDGGFVIDRVRKSAGRSDLQIITGQGYDAITNAYGLPGIFFGI